MDQRTQLLAIHIMTKVAGKDPVVKLLEKQAGFPQMPEKVMDVYNTVKDYISAPAPDSNELTWNGAKNLGIGAGATALTYGGLQLLTDNKKYKLLKLLAALGAGGLATYYGDDIRNGINKLVSKGNTQTAAV